MAVDLETIARRVEKLLALGTSSNEHEAAAAVAKAQALMESYGLIMEQITGRKANQSDVTEGTAFDIFERGKTDAWREQVLAEVARTSGVKAIRGYRSAKVESKHAKYGERYATYVTAYLIGLPQDVEMAATAYAFLTGEITRLAQAASDAHIVQIRANAKAEGISFHQAESDYVWRTGTHPLKAKASFTKGAAVGVIEMLRDEEHKRRGMATEAANALVVNRDAIVRDYWYQKQFGKTYDEYQAEMKERMDKWQAENPHGVGKAKSPSQLRKEAEANERRWRRQEAARQRAEERKWANIDVNAFVQGRAAGRQMRVTKTAIED